MTETDIKIKLNKIMIDEAKNKINQNKNKKIQSKE
jgi:hypothetical protein